MVTVKWCSTVPALTRAKWPWKDYDAFTLTADGEFVVHVTAGGLKMLTVAGTYLSAFTQARRAALGGRARPRPECPTQALVHGSSAAGNGDRMAHRETLFCVPLDCERKLPAADLAVRTRAVAGLRTSTRGLAPRAADCASAT